MNTFGRRWTINLFIGSLHAGRRGGRGGRGRGRGRGKDSSKPKTKEQLDAELDQYNMKDAKHAQTQLNDDLDDYFKNKGKKTAEAEAEAPAAQEEVAATT